MQIMRVLTGAAVAISLLLGACDNGEARRQAEEADLIEKNRIKKEQEDKERLRAEEEQRRAEEARLAAERNCIQQSYNASFGSDTVTVYTVIGAADAQDLAQCPVDYRQAFVRLRDSMALLIDAEDQLGSHSRREDEAWGQSTALTFLELLTEQPTYQTPVADWNNEKRALAERVQTLAARTSDDLSQLRQVAVGHGLTFGPRTQSPGNSTSATTNGM